MDSSIPSCSCGHIARRQKIESSWTTRLCCAIYKPFTIYPSLRLLRLKSACIQAISFWFSRCYGYAPYKERHRVPGHSSHDTEFLLTDLHGPKERQPPTLSHATAKFLQAIPRVTSILLNNINCVTTHDSLSRQLHDQSRSTGCTSPSIGFIFLATTTNGRCSHFKSFHAPWLFICLTKLIIKFQHIRDIVFKSSRLHSG